MINGKVFKEKRKQLNISQKELILGITNQTTLSLLENENKIPSATVLFNLAKRLQIDLNEVAGLKTPLNYLNLIRRVEKLIQTYKYADAKKIIEKFNDTDYNSLTRNEKLKFDFFKAVVSMWLNNDWDTAIFDFNNLQLSIIKNETNDVYSSLLLIETGVAYAQKKDTEKQWFYFKQAEHKLQGLKINSQNAYWILFILNNLCKFYSNQNYHDESIKLAYDGIIKAKQFSLVYFVEDFYYVLAYENELYLRNEKKALEYYYKASNFAEFCGNDLISKHADLHIKKLKKK